MAFANFCSSGRFVFWAKSLAMTTAPYIMRDHRINKAEVVVCVGRT